jgi:hypothetical protein
LLGLVRGSEAGGSGGVGGGCRGITADDEIRRGSGEDIEVLAELKETNGTL